MRSPIHTPFAAVFWNEVLLNSRRIAPYAMAILFAGNALLWWGWGPAAGRGLATNSEAFIAGVLPVFSFMTLPLFTALLMADPVIKDFRIGIAPLIFSKPVGRLQYLLGKFLANFFVLVCCQASFALTLFVLQAFRRPGMIVLNARAFPYLKHFVVFVVISHLALAAFYFTVGTLTRNSKIVYGLAISFYPLYIVYQTALLKGLPSRWRTVLDPLLMNWGDKSSQGRSAEFVNRLTVVYDSTLIANRALMILVAAICLAVLYARFAITERPGRQEAFSVLSLSTAAEEVYYNSERPNEMSKSSSSVSTERIETFENISSVPLPTVNSANDGIRAHLNKFGAVLNLEFRLLLKERSLVVFAPLAVLLSFLSLPFQSGISEDAYSAVYAANTATGMLLFLLGVIVFYTGEAMHRDRDLGIEQVLWSMPVSSGVLLFSKFLATISLTIVLMVLAAMTAIVTQLLRAHTTVEVSAYMITYAVILFPTIVFVTAASLALNVFLRDRYFAYAVCIAIGVGTFYLYNLGHNHWLYNPALYQLWNYPDLVEVGGSRARILTHRVYCLSFSCLWLAFAHLGFPRKSAQGFRSNGRLSAKGWAILMAVVSTVVAVVTGLMIK
jgi:ABC-type transport system involved in multi-copper enzyme maturation permease subunit